MHLCVLPIHLSVRQAVQYIVNRNLLFKEEEEEEFGKIFNFALRA
jgi:hypothetical protein